MLKLAFLFLALTLVTPTTTFAKRTAPPQVKPAFYQGARYTAPNDDGRRGYVTVWDAKTNRKLREITVFTNRIDPSIEEDAQWVYIKTLKVRRGTLIVTSERGKIHKIDLKAHAVSSAANAVSPYNTAPAGNAGTVSPVRSVGTVKPGFITMFGRHPIDQTRIVEVSNENQSIEVTFTHYSGNGSASASSKPSEWKAKPGWFVYVENARNVWAYDGELDLILYESMTIGNDIKSRCSGPSDFPCPVPEPVLARISEAARKAIKH